MPRVCWVIAGMKPVLVFQNLDEIVGDSPWTGVPSARVTSFVSLFSESGWDNGEFPMDGGSLCSGDVICEVFFSEYGWDDGGFSMDGGFLCSCDVICEFIFRIWMRWWGILHRRGFLCSCDVICEFVFRIWMRWWEIPCGRGFPLFVWRHLWVCFQNMDEMMGDSLWTGVPSVCVTSPVSVFSEYEWDDGDSLLTGVPSVRVTSPVSLFSEYGWDDGGFPLDGGSLCPCDVRGVSPSLPGQECH